MTHAMAVRNVQRFSSHPLSTNCAGIFKRSNHALIGISPFNSRFSDEYINRLIEWALHTFDDVSVLLAGKEAANLLEALGTPKGKAERKVRKEVSRNRRAAEKALKEHGGNVNAIHTFSDFNDNSAYNSMRAEAEHNFLNETHFRNACLEMSHAAILGRARGTNIDIDQISNDMLNIAVEYVIAELPFFIGGAEILGTQETVLIYHKPWELGEQIVGNDFSIKMKPNQGYLMVQEMEDLS
ncbi:tRNA-dependent cyclodipeptide synthase [Bacillus thuringiensis serovar roskildiensis]|uniref:Cyclodipeptide synthase n=1 Tax=Bacillus thuringiensis serovar sooncheon TaxID=180891 RepID=A0A9Q5SEF0_BACTU|nr:tRNA-dependent cyclodipeptide synthase [Bacillus thuringiensis]MEB9661627.1 tRNA-dependent cyclodipeptide synthase [Bacillus cereus]ARV91118.1 tRNA-dependent cyclodipeptide synthase [Bacillus thuringiensis]OTW68807.1 tRNA-dependent cyclodipeptide synthase [Bacillus thuringiensis serovar coreanensis]OTX42697.1 tRNA-dependent cyclodipeptide synthase [Bacillus thuringiensis serovar sooncheon]OTX54415.1 tRNA-dependent cyclodipeptide synthase [Bacillus thuringiensis serovar guiyangiensis]